MPGQAGRIDMTVRRDIGGAENALEIKEREELGRPLGRDDLERDAQRICNAFAMPKLVETLLGRGEPHATATVIIDRLPGLRFERLIELDAVLEKLHHVEARVELGAEPRGMPSRAAGQFVFLDQDGIAESELRQVVEQAAPGNAAADDDGFRFALHKIRTRHSTAPFANSSFSPSVWLSTYFLAASPRSPE